MSEILSKEEKRKHRRRSKITYKILSPSIEEIEISAAHLRTFHGDNEVIVSPIMKSLGDSGFHCFVNVLPNPKNDSLPIEKGEG